MAKPPDPVMILMREKVKLRKVTPNLSELSQKLRVSWSLGEDRQMSVVVQPLTPNFNAALDCCNCILSFGKKSATRTVLLTKDLNEGELARW